jgi:hypothetical protein
VWVKCKTPVSKNKTKEVKHCLASSKLRKYVLLNGKIYEGNTTSSKRATMLY